MKKQNLKGHGGGRWGTEMRGFQFKPLFGKVNASDSQ